MEIDVLLINSRFFGAGLNLQNSSDIIILHRQGADILHQIIGRAQRIGRSDSLNIWKLYHNNEAYNYVE
jgi:SNF2 family DNA or RNA helicase